MTVPDLASPTVSRLRLSKMSKTPVATVHLTRNRQRKGLAAASNRWNRLRTIGRMKSRIPCFGRLAADEESISKLLESCCGSVALRWVRLVLRMHYS